MDASTERNSSKPPHAPLPLSSNNNESKSPMPLSAEDEVLSIQEVSGDIVKSEAPASTPAPNVVLENANSTSVTRGKEQNNNMTKQQLSTHHTVIIKYKWKRHPFWNEGMKRFCDLIRERTKAIPSSQKDSTTVLVNFTTPCRKPYEVYHLGTGNIVMAVYGLRLAASTLGVEFVFQCSDVTEKNSRAYKQEVLPWLQGYFASPIREGKNDKKALPFSLFDPPIPPKGPTCRGFKTHPLHYMTEAMRHDFRTMAVAIYGGTEGKDSSTMKEYKSSRAPLVSNATIDDVAIHFRCGDILLIRTNTYGIVRFDSYRKHISPDATSIGIVTQSFEAKKNRDRDSHSVKYCHLLVETLAKYLEYFFPNATVTIRNDPREETPATSYARLVLANQTFSGLSTFSVFPAIASFGTSYVQEGRLTYFVPPIAEAYNNVKMMDGPVLTSNMIGEMKSPHDMIKWLVKEDHA